MYGATKPVTGVTSGKIASRRVELREAVETDYCAQTIPAGGS
jgi:hypothetical protein